MMNDGEPVFPVKSVGNLEKNYFERNQPKKSLSSLQVSLQRHSPKTHSLLASFTQYVCLAL